MSISSIIYRTRQFGQALHPRALTEADLAQAKEILTPKQLMLFSRLQPSEQIHSLRVLTTLQSGSVSHPDLFIAALLHDIGKIRYPLRLWQRIFIVLVKAIWPNHGKAWGKYQPKGWRTPFVIAVQHPAWGADLALKAGVSPLASNLIRKHQEKIN
jgi:hypothetical protein